MRPARPARPPSTIYSGQLTSHLCVPAEQVRSREEWLGWEYVPGGLGTYSRFHLWLWRAVSCLASRSDREARSE